MHGRIVAIRLIRDGQVACWLQPWMYEQADRLISPPTAGISAATQPWWALWLCDAGVIVFCRFRFGNILPNFSLVALQPSLDVHAALPCWCRWQWGQQRWCSTWF
jgi:hypothetical protein